MDRMTKSCTFALLRTTTFRTNVFATAACAKSRRNLGSGGGAQRPHDAFRFAPRRSWRAFGFSIDATIAASIATPDGQPCSGTADAGTVAIRARQPRTCVASSGSTKRPISARSRVQLT
jgi:hypothetical protein